MLFADADLTKMCPPVVDQMLVELEVVTDPERVGFYSGIIVSGQRLQTDFTEYSHHTQKESVFSLASLITSSFNQFHLLLPSDR